MLYGLSVGPGDPELLTVKALRLLQKTGVIAFPLGVGEKPGIAQEIISTWLHPSQIQLPLKFAFVHHEEILNQAWTIAAEEVWQYLKLGEDVAFVCEGDVGFYSTFTYLANKLKQLHPQVKIEMIPGVCSPLATAAVLGIPLTWRSQRLAILPALYNVTELETVLNWADVVVLMKISSVYPEVWRILQQRDLLDHAFVVEKATHPHQVIYQGLGEHPHLSLPYFSLMIIPVTHSLDLLNPLTNH